MKYVWLTGDYLKNLKRQEMASQLGCHLVIEFHFNSAPASARGGEVWYRPGDAKSLDVARAVLDGYKTVGLQKHGNGINEASKGTRAGWIRHYDMSAILLEPLFVSNPGEATWIHNDANVDSLAKILVDVVRKAFPAGSTIGLSVGHLFKSPSSTDKGANCVLGDYEADHANALAHKVANYIVPNLEFAKHEEFDLTSVDHSGRIVSFGGLHGLFNESNDAGTNAINSLDISAEDKAFLLMNVGEALNVLADAEDIPGVLTAVDHRFASLLQTYCAQHADDLVPLKSGGLEAKFDNTDLAGWFLSLLTWFKGIKKHPWVPNTDGPTPFPSKARLAMLGDWGTGLYGAPVAAQSISSDVEGFDLLIHLGDVYYSGDKKEIRDRFLKFWPKNDAWQRPVVNRACNSNHEMYTGAKAYFEETLKEFDQQSSFFVLQNQDWSLVGLDSAYFTPDVMHNKADLNDEQVGMLNELAKDPSRRIILFSHHQPFSYFESHNDKLVQKVSSALNSGRVFAWYWGHEHRCVLYSEHPTWRFFGRCCGHGGFPYFRDKIDAFGQPELEVGKVRWFSLPANNLCPAASLLDGPNRHIPGHEDEYGVQGYITLEFDGPSITEKVHIPEGDVVRTTVLS